MLETEFLVRRVSVVSARSFEQVVSKLTETIGRPDINLFRDAVAAATCASELEATIESAVGSSGLMEFARFDSGEILRTALGDPERNILRLVIGNPLVMKEMVKLVVDAASYAPVTILVDERDDGVHVSYDTMSSLLAPYACEPALAVARELDAKVGALIRAATR